MSDSSLSVPVTQFDPMAALLGGALIGGAALLLMLANGRIAGISGIIGRLLPPVRYDASVLPQAAFVLGLVLAPLALMASGMTIEQVFVADRVMLAISGLLVGFGSVLGSGCTSGHGVCGIARLSLRSIVSTMVFMATGVATVFVLRHLVGG